MVRTTKSREGGKKTSSRERRNALRKLREGFEISLDELAKKSGLSKSMISKFELGHRDISAEGLDRIEKALNSIAAKRVVSAIGPEDRDYLAYKDLQESDPQLLQMIARIVDASKKDLKWRNTFVEALRRLSSEHNNQLVKRWYEAERDALLAFENICELEARFKLELGTKLLGIFTINTANALEEKLRALRGLPNGDDRGKKDG